MSKEEQQETINNGMTYRVESSFAVELHLWHFVWDILNTRKGFAEKLL